LALLALVENQDCQAPEDHPAHLGLREHPGKQDLKVHQEILGLLVLLVLQDHLDLLVSLVYRETVVVRDLWVLQDLLVLQGKDSRVLMVSKDHLVQRVNLDRLDHLGLRDQLVNRVLLDREDSLVSLDPKEQAEAVVLRAFQVLRVLLVSEDSQDQTGQ